MSMTRTIRRQRQRAIGLNVTHARQQYARVRGANAKRAFLAGLVQDLGRTLQLENTNHSPDCHCWPSMGPVEVTRLVAGGSAAPGQHATKATRQHATTVTRRRSGVST